MWGVGEIVRGIGVGALLPTVDATQRDVSMTVRCVFGVVDCRLTERVGEVRMDDEPGCYCGVFSGVRRCCVRRVERDGLREGSGCLCDVARACVVCATRARVRRCCAPRGWVSGCLLARVHASHARS